MIDIDRLESDHAVISGFFIIEINSNSSIFHIVLLLDNSPLSIELFV